MREKLKALKAMAHPAARVNPAVLELLAEIVEKVEPVKKPRKPRKKKAKK